ncbi:hypothetical protein [Agromyces sp. NPDC058104]|uniref:hypothetical protein n=1 Tax=Agromyces sp. NPDC058104 TaxID=3346342 RepID=UPI0036DCACE6
MTIVAPPADTSKRGPAPESWPAYPGSVGLRQGPKINFDSTDWVGRSTRGEIEVTWDDAYGYALHLARSESAEDLRLSDLVTMRLAEALRLREALGAALASVDATRKELAGATVWSRDPGMATVSCESSDCIDAEHEIVLETDDTGTCCAARARHGDVQLEVFKQPEDGLWKLDILARFEHLGDGVTKEQAQELAADIVRFADLVETLNAKLVGA